MGNLQLISGYRDNAALRSSFNRLAVKVFGIDFEEWYQKGWWSDRYVCYSYIDGMDVVANVSANMMDMVWEGKSLNAVQLGTVMTHPEYRGKGLAASLMNTVMYEYENKSEFIYLFANDKVLDFYPRFGFGQMPESRLSMDAGYCKAEGGILRKLDISNPCDNDTLVRIASKRVPVSSVLGVKNDLHLIMFYCLYVFKDNIHYLESEDVVVIFKQDNDTLDVYDIISSKQFDLKSILDRIIEGDVKKVVFHFTPDLEDTGHIACEPKHPPELFIRPAPAGIKHNFVFPEISHA